VLLLFVLRFVRLLFSGHQAVAVENAALRMQIAAFQRKRKRPLLTTVDRVFWVTLRSVWSDWRHPLLYIQGHRRPLAARTVPQILVQVVQLAASASRSPRHSRGTTPIDRANGHRQFVVARTQDSWRTPDARYRDLRTHRVAHRADAPAAT
jgi:hypothetical protein